MTLTYDHQGFIVGAKKSLDEQLQHQKAIKQDSATIIRLLQGELAVSKRQAIKKKTAQKAQAQNTPNQPIEYQQRDGKGRFVAKSKDGTTKDDKKQVGNMGRLVSYAGKTLLDIVKQKFIADGKNLDPFIDAMNETRELLHAPTGFMGKFLKQTEKLPKPKERFYRKLHKKLTNLINRFGIKSSRVNFGVLGKIGGRFTKALLRGIIGLMAFVLGGLFVKKTIKTPKKQKQLPKKPQISKQNLKPIEANTDKTLFGVAKEQFSKLTNSLISQNLPKKLLTLFGVGLAPFFKGAGEIFEWVKQKVEGFFGIDNSEPENPNDNPTNPATDPNTTSGATGFAGNHSTFSDGALNITETDIIRLAKIMESETGKSGYHEKWRADMGLAVVDTVINRVVDSAFPNTIKGVANQKNQFSGINGPKTYKDKHGNVRKTGATGDVDLLPAPKQESIDLVRSHLANLVNGQKRLVTTTHFLNPHVSSANAMKQWGNKAVAKGVKFGKGQFVHYHAGRHVNDYGIRLATPSTAQNHSKPTTNKPTLGTPRTLVFGDSIANQYGRVNQITHNYGKDGATPTQVLKQLNDAIHAGTLKRGDKVVLSTGLSNGMIGNDEVIAKQMKLLKQHGVSFDVLGVANNFKDNTKQGISANTMLQRLALEHGARFLGGFNYNPNDKYKAHPTNDYIKSLHNKPLREQMGQQIMPALPLKTTTPPPKQPMISQSITSSDKGKTIITAQHDIGQNVADERLAMAITGGIGKRT